MELEEQNLGRNPHGLAWVQRSELVLKIAT